MVDHPKYIYEPLGDITRGRRKMKNTQNGSADYRDRRGDDAGASHGWPLDYIDINCFVTMMKME
jgi:hypothetical protein